VAGDPYPKSRQLARYDRRYRRKVAAAKDWQKIQAAKQGPCRVSQKPPPNEMAHLIPRSQGGPDEAWNIVPLSRGVHTLFDGRHTQTVLRVLASLTDDEYAGLVQHGGEGVFERHFRVEYQRP